MAYYLHRSPWWFHHFETLSNHFLELLVPFFLFLGRRMCILHGVLQILFQVGCAKVPPLGVPVCLPKTRKSLLYFCVHIRAVGRGLTGSISSPAGAPLHLIQAGFPGPLPGFHEPVCGGVRLPSESCLRAVTQTLLRPTSAPHRHSLCS